MAPPLWLSLSSSLLFPRRPVSEACAGCSRCRVPKEWTLLSPDDEGPPWPTIASASVEIHQVVATRTHVLRKGVHGIRLRVLLHVLRGIFVRGAILLLMLRGLHFCFGR